MNRQTQLEDRIRDHIQKPLTIIRKDVNDGESIGRFIVDSHLRGFGGLRQGPRQFQPRPAAKHIIHVFPPLQDRCHTFTNHPAPLCRWWTAVVGIRHLKRIDDNPVRSGENLRVQDLKPTAGHHARDF